ncbi:MAG: NAD(+)/NADH kinase [Deltaproteobacteria bacterium]|nr:NAD(+)/NADH kinase [Deltaproteobacteria bacterium]
MKKIAIIIKRNKPEGLGLAKELIPWLKERGIEAVFDKEVIGPLGIKKGYSKTEIHEIADLIIVLGGDGTLLSIARLAGKRSIPILGVNLGSLGFLTEMTVDELFPILERILESKYDLEERMMLKASIYRQGEKITEYSALNDVVISKGSMARIIDLDTRIDDNFLTLYRVDGLIFSTPTGSTGYSLAAAGPIVHPTLKAIIIAPICPFTLNNRPIMIPDQSRISVTLKTENVDYLLTMDGQVAFALKEGDTIEIEKSENLTKLIKSPYRDYYEVLRTKLQWSGSR